MQRRVLLAGFVVAGLLAAAPLAGQTVGPVLVSIGAGPSVQTDDQFSRVGVHLWAGTETVLDRRVRVRLDAALHHFSYAGPTSFPSSSCPRDFCAPPQTSNLDLIAVTGTVVWRDTTNVRRWYGFAGLGAYGVLHLRDGNSRIGITGGLGLDLGSRWFAEARTHLAYDATGYRGVVFPILVGRRIGRFVP